MAHRSALEHFYWDSIVGPAVAPERARDLERLNDLFAAHAKTLMTAEGRPPSREIFVGGYPIHSASAFVSLQPEGVIVLVHQGLVAIAHVLGSVLAASVPAITQDRFEPPELDARPADALIAGVVAALIREVNPLPYELRSASREPFATFLTDYLIDFVLAHELAHVLLGHLDSEARPVTTSASKTIAISLPSWQQELTADEFAFQLVAAILPDRVTLESRFMPATLFFELLESEAAARRPRTTQPTSLEHVADLVSHPPAAHRRSALIVSSHPDGPLAIMPRLDMIVERMSAARGRPLQRPDPGALDRLATLAKRFDPTPLEAALGIGAAASGVTVIDLSRLGTFLAENLERARCAVAMTAFGAAASGYATRELFRMHLGAVLLCAPQTIQDDADLMDLVRQCVPDVAELTTAVARHVEAQP